MFIDLPGGLGFDSPPIWWPIPLLATSGVLVALCIRSLPGNCGHSPSGGFQQGAPTLPIELPGSRSPRRRRWRSVPCSAPKRR